MAKRDGRTDSRGKKRKQKSEKKAGRKKRESGSRLARRQAPLTGGRRTSLQTKMITSIIDDNMTDRD